MTPKPRKIRICKKYQDRLFIANGLNNIQKLTPVKPRRKKSLVGWIHAEDWLFIGKLDTGFNDCTGIYYIPNLIKGKPKFCDDKIPCKVRITISELNANKS